jgi:hypothetical protein
MRLFIYLCLFVFVWCDFIVPFIAKYRYHIKIYLQFSGFALCVCVNNFYWFEAKVCLCDTRVRTVTR